MNLKFKKTEACWLYPLRWVLAFLPMQSRLQIQNKVPSKYSLMKHLMMVLIRLKPIIFIVVVLPKPFLNRF